MDAGELRVMRGIAKGFGRGPTRPDQTVYFIQANAPTGLVKIGCAAHPSDRVRSLQTGSPALLTLLGTEPGGAARERELHQQFADSRAHGEWFRPTPGLLLHIAGVRR